MSPLLDEIHQIASKIFVTFQDESIRLHTLADSLEQMLSEAESRLGAQAKTRPTPKKAKSATRCPQCGKPVKPRGLGIHLARKHGLTGDRLDALDAAD